MKNILFKNNYEKIPNLNFKTYYYSIFKLSTILILFINILIMLYLILENIKIKNLVKELTNANNIIFSNKNNKYMGKEIINFEKEIFADKINNIENELLKIKEAILKSNDKKNLKIINDNKEKNKKIRKDDLYIDKDMIGLKYPEINFDIIKNYLIENKITFALYEFLEQLEIKLIYLEKEINITKLNSFYTTRTLYLKKNKVNMMTQI